MIADFNKAMLNKIKKVYDNTQYADAALVYNAAYQLMEQDDPKYGKALKFPLINIYKVDGFSMNDEQPFAAVNRGIGFYNEENGNYSQARFISLNLPYQIDIYAKTHSELEQITEQLMFFLKLRPTVEVVQHDKANNLDYIETFEITYNSGATEQSEFTDGDRTYHYALVYEIRNARILDFTSSDKIDSYKITLKTGTDNDEVIESGN